jgi:hypothetical protein
MPNDVQTRSQRTGSQRTGSSTSVIRICTGLIVICVAVAIGRYSAPRQFSVAQSATSQYSVPPAQCSVSRPQQKHISTAEQIEDTASENEHEFALVDQVLQTAGLVDHAVIIRAA